MSIETQIDLPEDIELYSTKTAAKSTSFSERYWIEHIRKGNIPMVRIGKSVRIRREDLLAFLNDRIKESEAPKRESEPPKRAGHVYKRKTARKSSSKIDMDDTGGGI